MCPFYLHLGQLMESGRTHLGHPALTKMVKYQHLKSEPWGRLACADPGQVNHHSSVMTRGQKRHSLLTIGPHLKSHGQTERESEQASQTLTKQPVQAVATGTLT